MEELTAPITPTSPVAHSFLRTVFFGPNGLRAGWSALIFIAIFAGEMIAVRWLHSLIVHGPGQNGQAGRPTSFTWVFGLTQEGSTLAMLILPLWVMSRIEHKPIAVYGYRGRASASRFVYGLGWGFAAISALVLALWKLGYLAFDSYVLAGSRAWKYAAVWALIFVLVALFEESFLRGYLQHTLARGVGFWWAALLLSCGFGAMHGVNPGESPIGLFGAGAVGLVFCLSLWYTGSLWWAIGFHAAWDWGESFFYGTADSGLLAQGHLLQEHPVGNLYWSGGATGPEGSALALVLLAITSCAMIVWWGRRTVSPFADYGWRPPRPAQVQQSDKSEIQPAGF